MEMVLVNDKRSEEYYRFIKSLDDDFLPRLSEREGGIRAFIDIVYDKYGKTLVAKEGGRIVGSFSYWVTPSNDMYVWLLAVAPELRGTYKGMEAICHLFQVALADESHCQHIEFTTWSTNRPARKLYRALGFEHYKAVDNDMVEGRTTLYYKNGVGEFYRKFTRIAQRFAH